MPARFWSSPSLVLSLSSLLAASSLTADQATPAPVFTPTPDSLRRYSVPPWFTEARVGLSVYWGVNSVPGRHLDYARRLYLPPERGEANESYLYHRKHYGHPSVFGYKDLIPYWEAQSWDAPGLARQFKESGARYVIVLATDQDNFDLFASRHQPWNATRFGPERDIVGTWAKVLRAEGLPWGVAAHHGRAWWFLRPSHGYDWEGPQADQFFDGRQTERDGGDQWWEGLSPRDLYGPARPGDAATPEPAAGRTDLDPPSSTFQENWFLRLSELTSTYQPDLVWMRTGLPHGLWGLRWAAQYYEDGRFDHGPRTRRVLLLPASTALPAQAHVRHLAPSLPLPTPTLQPWQREIWLAPEGLRTDLPAAYDAIGLQRELARTAARGGNLLIQIALRADGTLPSTQSAALADLGKWLNTNGEAIYGTSAGPGFSLPEAVATSRDGGKVIYVHLMPGANTRSLLLPGLSSVESATWLGGGPASFQVEAEGLRLALPAALSFDQVRVVKLAIRVAESVPDY